MGKMAVELYWDHAPKTCKNFAELARRGYYNGTIFHRIISDFMIQGGDPTGTGFFLYSFFLNFVLHDSFCTVIIFLHLFSCVRSSEISCETRDLKSTGILV